jgi:aminocarboxymuconate-semialdehyde decarboxylase
MVIDGQLFREVEDSCWDPDRRLADCRRHGVGLQVLSTVPVMFSYWARPEHTLDLARLLNDHLAEVVTRHPEHFVALGTLPMQAPDLAIGELERCVRELGFPGVQIGSHVNGWNLDHPNLFPILQAAERLGAAVFVHPWDMFGKERMQNYFLPWLVGMPAETSLAICSVIFGGVLDRLPRLRLCFAHGGGAFPHSPSSYLGRFYVDSLVHDADALRRLLQLFGPQRVALGSDYPFPLGETEPGRLIESLPELSGKVKRQLLADTAREFLGLKSAKREARGDRHGRRLPAR